MPVCNSLCTFRCVRDGRLASGGIARMNDATIDALRRLAGALTAVGIVFCGGALAAPA